MYLLIPLCCTDRMSLKDNTKVYVTRRGKVSGNRKGKEGVNIKSGTFLSRLLRKRNVNVYIKQDLDCFRTPHQNSQSVHLAIW